MSMSSFLVVERPSSLVQKSRYLKHDLTKCDNGLYVYCRAYAQGVIGSDFRWQSAYLEFIKSVSCDVGVVYCMVKNIAHQEAMDNMVLTEYFADRADKPSYQHCPPIQAFNADKQVQIGVMYRYDVDEQMLHGAK